MRFSIAIIATTLLAHAVFAEVVVDEYASAFSEAAFSVEAIMSEAAFSAEAVVSEAAFSAEAVVPEAGVGIVGEASFKFASDLGLYENEFQELEDEILFTEEDLIRMEQEDLAQYEAEDLAQYEEAEFELENAEADRLEKRNIIDFFRKIIFAEEESAVSLAEDEVSMNEGEVSMNEDEVSMIEDEVSMAAVSGLDVEAEVVSLQEVEASVSEELYNAKDLKKRDEMIDLLPSLEDLEVSADGLILASEIEMEGEMSVINEEASLVGDELALEFDFENLMKPMGDDDDIDVVIESSIPVESGLDDPEGDVVTDSDIESESVDLGDDSELPVGDDAFVSVDEVSEEALEGLMAFEKLDAEVPAEDIWMGEIQN